MKKANIYIFGGLLILSFEACNGTNNSSNQAMNPGDSAVTTTTSVAHHRYSGSFAPQPNTKYLDLKTQKEIQVRIDTVRGEVVNNETSEPVDLFVEPEKHDTIYGQTGTVVNNYITKDETGYRVDTVRIRDTVTVSAPSDKVVEGKYKEKDKARKTKIKTDDEKIKEKKNKIKEKEE